jgi:uncharacterized protein involved in response to NO
MTLAVMTRASLGHTGRPLVASPTTQLIYLLVLLAAIMRIVAALAPSSALLSASGGAWFLAFAGFAMAFGPPLAASRPGCAERR